MARKGFWKMPTAVAAFCLGFALVLTGCGGAGSPAGNGGGGGIGGQGAPVNATIAITGIPSQHHGSWGELDLIAPATGNRAGWSEVSAIGSTATFTLTAVPGIYHVFFSFSGGSRVMPSLEIAGGTITIPWDDFYPPISITVTGIPSQHHGSWASIELLFPGTGNRGGWASTSISGNTTTFTVAGFSGLYEVRLRFGSGDDARIYRTSSITYLLAEETVIPWSAFVFMPPPTITVTDIPSEYQGLWAVLILMIPGTMNDVADSHEEIAGSSATFTVRRGVVAGTYDVVLAFADEFILGVYSVSARNITTDTTIPFSQFAALPPRITITITGIPVEYQNGFALVGLECIVTGNEIEATSVPITESSAIARFWLASPGTYDVWLWIEGSERWREAVVPSRNITANATIPWSAFTFVDGGELVSITITGIPEEYHGDWGDITLRYPGTGQWAGTSGTFIRGDSATFRLWVDPGTYDVELWLNDRQVRYVLPSPRAITAGMTIPFNQFAPSPQGHQQAFSAPLEHSGRALPGRAADPPGTRSPLRARR